MATLKANKDFQRQLKKYLKVVDKEGTKGIRSVSLQALKMVMKKSPVDKGTFRGNWNVGINKIDDSYDYDAGGNTAKYSVDQNTFNRGGVIIGGVKIGDGINISNALPYANRLEFGYSDQAPSGMIRTTEHELKLWLKKKNDKV